MSITSVSFTFENGVKREEYGPTRKASATIIYGVDDHENGEAVLAHIAHVARHRVQDSIGAPQPPPAQATPAEAQAAGRADADLAPTKEPADPQPSASTSGAAQSEQPSVEPAKRTRRTKAEIEADRLAAANPPSAAPTVEPGSDTSASATNAQPASQDQTASTQPASSPPSSDGSALERIIDNAELTGACAAAAQRLGGITAVKDLIKAYTGRDPPQVADILSSKRQEFLDKLAALT